MSLAVPSLPFFPARFIGQTSPICLYFMAPVTSESMCAANESTVKTRGDRGNVCVRRQCLLSCSCNFNQSMSVTGLAALRRQLRLSFMIIIQVLFPFSLALLRQGQPWLIWAICSVDYERCWSPASAPHMLLRSHLTHTHIHRSPSLSALFQALSSLAAVWGNHVEGW